MNIFVCLILIYWCIKSIIKLSNILCDVQYNDEDEYIDDEEEYNGKLNGEECRE